MAATKALQGIAEVLPKVQQNISPSRKESSTYHHHLIISIIIPIYDHQLFNNPHHQPLSKAPSPPLPIYGGRARPRSKHACPLREAHRHQGTNTNTLGTTLGTALGTTHRHQGTNTNIHAGANTYTNIHGGANTNQHLHQHSWQCQQQKRQHQLKHDQSQWTVQSSTSNKKKILN